MDEGLDALRVVHSEEQATLNAQLTIRSLALSNNLYGIGVPWTR